MALRAINKVSVGEFGDVGGSVIAAIGAYWGDGTKSLSGCLEFTNSEPILVKSFIKMMEKLFSVQPNELKYKIKIHENALRKNFEEVIIKRWSSILGIPPESIKLVVVKSRKKTTMRIRIPEEFGSMQVRYCKRAFHRKLLALMNALINKASNERKIAIPLLKGLLAADGYIHPSRTGRLQEITIAEKSKHEKQKIMKVLGCLGISSHLKGGRGSAVVVYGYNNFRIFKNLKLFSLSERKLKKFLSLY